MRRTGRDLQPDPGDARRAGGRSRAASRREQQRRLSVRRYTICLTSDALPSIGHGRVWACELCRHVTATYSLEIIINEEDCALQSLKHNNNNNNNNNDNYNNNNDNNNNNFVLFFFLSVIELIICWIFVGTANNYSNNLQLFISDSSLIFASCCLMSLVTQTGM